MSPSEAATAITGGGAPRARPRSPATGALWRAAKRFLYVFHRWTGIVLCLFFAVWFVSGVVMMYVPFPSFRASERIAGAAPIDWARVRVAPDAALARLHESAFPEEMRLGMSGQVPVYHIVTEDGRRAVSAETGQEIRAVDTRQAGAIAAAFVGAPVASTAAVSQDQWVVTRAYKKIAPFWRVRLTDPAATDVYVVQRTGEIVQNTTADERFWNWLGAVPHWIYFEALRVFQEPWRQTVLWTSGVGLLGAIAGIWIGLLRVRLAKRYKSGSVSPYRGWMKWHHVIGLVGGLFVVTWVFSGWLSMSPWGGLRDEDKGVAERYAGTGPGFAATDLRRLAATAGAARELEFRYLDGMPVIVAWHDPERKSLLDGATGEPLALPQDRIAAIARAAVTDGRLVRVQRLERYDSYWYATGDPRRDARPLPVLRLVFDDPAETWLHVDPATGTLLARTGSGGRSYRWLFAALHSFDLPFLLENRWLRDLLMWLFSAAGLAVSISGVVIGWRRLRPPAKALRAPGGA
ncbi:PepSY domain-containing protein [Novosphingobium sp. JCM 18896]|uniref:PepSY domain-containing protein n=1 Tax=Novosphingobium sp. JCM 18896 TaxID=2989731 RepID=UPI0022214AB9|nr:PepSY domain-containing protein [Novosphingobium sp. JCM 18896]MCW1429508.1 PepSY domain-containing protein [Novosphingobium sp. JCM 18896]